MYACNLWTCTNQQKEEQPLIQKHWFSGFILRRKAMTAGRYLVTRMLISALLIDMEKLESISMCSRRRC